MKGRKDKAWPDLTHNASVVTHNWQRSHRHCDPLWKVSGLGFVLGIPLP